MSNRYGSELIKIIAWHRYYCWPQYNLTYVISNLEGEETGIGQSFGQW